MKKLTTTEFISKAKNIHGDKYDYSKVEYTNSKGKICIICQKHGEFWQEANSHLQGSGCSSCVGLKKPTSQEFIEKARKIHKDKYDYSKIDYINSQTKIKIVCPIHGEFLQKPNDHLNGQGCPKCGKKILWDRRGRITTEEFIERAKKIHGDKYDYSKVIYNGSLSPITIICPKHGEFIQKPTYHLMGHGCPICKESKLEEKTRRKLNSENIVFESCKKFDWLGNQHLDFYLPKYNVAIECQGEQHFEPIKHFGGFEKFIYYKKRDLKKYNLCKENKVKLYYYTSSNLKKYENSFSYYRNNLYDNIDDIINEIKHID